MALIRTEPLTDYYEVKEELGRGRFAVVKRCLKISTGEVFAAKCIRKARAGRRGREQLLLEIDILHTSDHPKMVKLYDVFETRSEMILILEYAAGGDLHKHCLEVESVRTEKEICSLIYQIVQAAMYLHDHHVVHLDLKPENILLKNDQKFPEIRLIDFGLSRRVDLPYSQYDIVGTPEYVAPEVLSYEPIQISADLWSIGVVCYVLLSGISPFAGDDVMETYANIANVDFDFDAEEFDDISDEAKDFIEALLIKDPKERLTTQECLEHPWLKQMSEGVKEQDIEAALIAKEAFEKFREESVSRLDSEGDSVFSTEGEEDQAVPSDDSDDVTTDDAEDSYVKEEVFPADNNETNGYLQEKPPRVEEIFDLNGATDSVLPIKEQFESVDDENLDESNTQPAKSPEPVQLPEPAKLSESAKLSEPAKLTESVKLREPVNLPEPVKLPEPTKLPELAKTLEQAKLPEPAKLSEPAKLPEPKALFTGGFDIDSLICKDEDDSSKVELPNEHYEGHLKTKANPKFTLLNEVVNGIERDENKNVLKEDLISKEPDSDASKKSKFQENEPSRETLENQKDAALLVNDKKRQRHSGNKLNSRASTTSIVSKYKESNEEIEGRVTLVKAKSVDDSLLQGKRKTSDVAKNNKLGAHLEKLTKAGLNLVDGAEPKSQILSPSRKTIGDETDYVDTRALKQDSQLSHKDFVKVGMKNVLSRGSKSSGSTTPSSGRATPETTSVDHDNEQPAKIAINEEKDNDKVEQVKISPAKTTVVEKKGNAPFDIARSQPSTPSSILQPKLKEDKFTPLGCKSKPSTPSEEKSAYPKKSHLGVRQGIAAQMASKFTSSAEKVKTPPPARLNKAPGQAVSSNRKYWEGNGSEPKETEVARPKGTQPSAMKIDRSFFANAVKVAKGESSQQETAELERKARSPRNSPKLGRSANIPESQVKERAEKYLKASSDTSKTQFSVPQVEGYQSRTSNRLDGDAPVLRKAGSKENIIQKFEKQKQTDEAKLLGQVHVQPKGLQFNFNLQAGNKFKQKDQSVEPGKIHMSKRDTKEGKKTVTFDNQGELKNRKKLELVTVPQSFSGMLDKDSADRDNVLADVSNDHVEYTAIGAIATMPRTPLRELRSRSRTSRDGSPLSPRKAYRRLYVTHVKGSKSEQETDVAEDIAELKTKVEKDELKVELLVKFGTL